MAGRPRPLPASGLRALVRVALGQAPAEALITDARVVNVFNQQISEPTTVALAQGRVAAIGPEAPAWRGPQTQVWPAGGAYLLPGLIDAHTHLDSLFQLGPYSELAMARGNTSAMTELAMMAGAWGIEGLRLMLAEAAAAPMRIFSLAPPLVPPFPEWETSAGLSFAHFQEVLAHPDCLGVGETYWLAIIDGEERATANYAAAQALGKTLEGHGAGARGPRLTAYAAAGTTSCHESVSAADAAERLALGLAVMVREGFVRREMAAVVPALRDLPEAGLAMLVTDLADFDDLIAAGAMNPLLAKAVDLGVAPARAVAWCSLNPARYYGLRYLGAVAPGYVADLVLVEDLQEFRARWVWLEGRLVAQEGRLLAPARPFAYPPAALATTVCPALPPEAFHLAAPGPRAQVRVVEAAGDTITKQAQAELPVERGNVLADPSQDVVKMAHVNRHSPERKMALGFAKGWGLRQGALATNLIWDTTNLFVAGCSEAEMSLAAETVRAMGGGLAVVAGQRVLARLPLPIAGIISPGPVAEAHRLAEDCRRALGQLGCPLPRPFLMAQTFCFTGLPFLRLTDKGLVDVRARKFVEVLL
ncbi:MAG: adenine deaminase C-terminal domain-containing protein [Thermodesulfobacteriota bacterium]